jgi:5-methyltetrahydrofolate--homocysteine methyltransferase
MPTGFSRRQWEKVAHNARAWWEGRLDRPLVQVYVGGQDAGRPAPSLPGRSFASHYDLSVPAEAIVDRWDYDIARTKYLGDAFPHVWPNFGPGVMAGFLGSRVHNTSNTTWFEPLREAELDELEFTFDPGNVWLRRIEDLVQAAMERWKGRVQVAMTDLGGTLDVLASFRPAERLLMDLYDHPARVEELTWRLHELWWQYFDRLDAILRGGADPGYTAWTPLFSETPYYMLQCDLSYMISPQMFERFVLPELAASCRRLGNPAYHLDGPGQIPHVDMLLGIPELKVIQYVPTVAARDATQYPDLYRRIREGGKLIQVYSNHSRLGLGLVDVLAEQLGDARGIAMVASVDAGQEAEARAFLRRYGIDEE